MPIGPGTHLGSYIVQDFIGQGAMGVVYRAYHAQLERSCAVKVLQGLTTDGDSYSRFLLEAKAIAHMRHPNVLNVFDFGEFEGQPYMIVEFVEGGSLSSRLKGAPLDHETALAYLHGIADALDYAQSLGIVHRDIKPANVLLGPGDTPILADFGLVKLMQAASIASMTGVTTGTPAYMAPEQVSGKHVGPAADRYSLAVVAFEMLTGSFPFNEDGVLEVLYAHVHKEPAAASTVNPGLGPRTDAVLLRGLAKDPAMRWETCESMVTALEQTLRSAGPVTERTIVFEPPALVVDAVSTEPLLVKGGPATAVIERPEPKAAISPSATVPIALPHPEDRKRRRRTGVVIGAAALVLVLLIAGVCLFQVSRPPTLDVSPHVATYGQHVAVTATHVPRNQSGQIHLESVLHTFAFRAADNGNVTFDLTVPSDIETGDHTVSICWSGSCHAQTKLRVVAGVAETSPLPSATPSGSPTASPSPTDNPTSQPGSTPHPGSTPTSAPRSSPSPTPTRAPSPTPSTNPCPTSGTAAISYSPTPVIAGVTQVTVSGSHFTPNKSVTVYYYFPSSSSTPKKTITGQTVACDGTFTGAKFTPGLTDIGTGLIKACDSTGRCATKSIGIT